MVFAHQSDGALPSSPFRVATWMALAVLATTLGLRLGRAEFLPAEAWHAEVALGPGARDFRAPDPTPTHRALAAWAAVTGTTERSLRLLVVLLAVIAAAVIGRTMAARFGPRAEPWPALLLAAAPILNREDLLYAGLLAILPVALTLQVLAPLGRRTLGSALAATFGAFLCGAMGGRPAWVAIAIAGAGICVQRPAWGLPVALAMVGATAGGLWARGDGWSWPLADLTAPGEPDLLLVWSPGPDWLSSWTPAVLCAGALLVAVLFTETGLRRVLTLALASAAAVLAALAFVPGGDTSPGHLAMDGAACVLAVLAAVLAAAASGLRRMPACVVFGMLLAAAILPLTTRHPDFIHPPLPPRNPMRDALDRARDIAPSGSRLVAWGDARFGLLYYARLGHGPGIPIILIPEEVTWDELADSLRERLGAGAGIRTPAVLVHPIPDTYPQGLIPLSAPGHDLVWVTLASL